MKKIIIVTIIIIIVISAVILVKKRRNALENTPLPERPISAFHVAAVSSGTVPEHERYSGLLHAEQTVSLAPRV